MITRLRRYLLMPSLHNKIFSGTKKKNLTQNYFSRLIVKKKYTFAALCFMQRIYEIVCSFMLEKIIFFRNICKMKVKDFLLILSDISNKNNANTLTLSRFTHTFGNYKQKTFTIASLLHLQQCWQECKPGSSFFGESRAEVFKTMKYQIIFNNNLI